MSMAHRLSPVVRDLPPSGIRKFFDLAIQMKDVISLGVGEPDFVTPWHVREACYYSLERGHTSYTPNHGLPELREAIANYLTQFELQYKGLREILVTVGGSEAIDLALRTIVCPGDEVLIPEPTYVSYRPCAILAGATPIPVSTFAEHGFRVTAANLVRHITPRTKAIILCSPNNPTGSSLREQDLREIAALAKEHDLFVISDEIYSELSYDGQHVSIAAQPGMHERTIVVSGMSKAFAMTGWRIGFAASSEELIQEMVKVHQYTIMCAPIMGQMAALEALRNGQEEKRKMVEQYQYRRNFVVKGLSDIGLSCHTPQGAFYAFPDVRSTGLNDVEFAEQLLRQRQVAVVPGSVFGEAGTGFIRCSYATSLNQLEQALERMASFVQQVRWA